MPTLQFIPDRSARRLMAWLVFAISFGAYLKTLCPTVYTMDNAELAIAAYRLGIAHPTGYPLFCLLGKLFTLLIPARRVLRVSSPAAVLTVLPSILFIRSFGSLAIRSMTCKSSASCAVAAMLSFTARPAQSALRPRCLARF